MNYEIITNRINIEKSIEDIYKKDTKHWQYIDYADIRRLRELCSFKYGIKYEVELNSNSYYVEDLRKIIADLPFELSSIGAYIIILTTSDDTTTTYDFLKTSEIRHELLMVALDKTIDDTIDDTTNIPNSLLDAICVSDAPDDKIQVYIAIGLNKEEGDKVEDEVIYAQIEEYHHEINKTWGEQTSKIFEVFESLGFSITPNNDHVIITNPE